MRNFFSLLFSLTLLTTAPAYAAAPPPDKADACAGFLALVKGTYTFRPSKLSDAERKEKIAAMDKVWDTAKKDPSHITPCLRTALQSPEAQPWFLVDGSDLLLALDPAKASKEIYARNWSRADLEDVNLKQFVTSLARLGAEGFDVAEGALNLLSHPARSYNLPAHATVISGAGAAAFLVYSMEDAQARAVLLKVLANPQNPRRQEAAQLLIDLQTPETVRDLKKLDLSGFSKQTQDEIKGYLAAREAPLTPSKTPQLTRPELLAAFTGLLEGNAKSAEATGQILERPQWAPDAVAVLTAADVPTLRRVRRYVAARATPHAFASYRTLTQVIATLDHQALLRAR